MFSSRDRESLLVGKGSINTEGVEPRLEAVVFVTVVLFVESLGLCVVALVDAFLAGVD